VKASIGIILLFVVVGCQNNFQLSPVSVSDFSEFVEETNYITEADVYGWSIVQKDVFNFETINGANWILPNGQDSSQQDFPVTQVSYNDALAYCRWAQVTLPTYEQYWEQVENDQKPIIANTSFIHALSHVNIVGNVWDITLTENSLGEIRLAGGSYLCNPNACNGTNVNRILYVDKTTGNSHIGFSVLK